MSKNGKSKVPATTENASKGGPVSGARGKKFRRWVKAINQAHSQFLNRVRLALHQARKAGDLLLLAKAECPHGSWLPWLRANFKFSERTAQDYMRIAREWPNLVGSNPQRTADLNLQEAIKLLTDSTPITTKTTALPPSVQHYLDRGAINQEQVEVLLTLRDIYGPDLGQTVIGLQELQYPCISIGPDGNGVMHRAEDLPPAKAADGLINLCRPEDQPMTWGWRLPFSTEPPVVVIEATEAFGTDLAGRSTVVPQWEVAAFWWASQVAMVTEFTGFDAPTEWLRKHIGHWRERYEQALVWLHLRKHDAGDEPEADPAHGDSRDEGEHRRMELCFRSDLRHSSSLERVERLNVGTDRDMLIRVMGEMNESNMIYSPSAMLWERMTRKQEGAA
jgi:Protein of unknown function (DUF3102)